MAMKTALIVALLLWNGRGTYRGRTYSCPHLVAFSPAWVSDGMKAQAEKAADDDALGGIDSVWSSVAATRYGGDGNAAFGEMACLARELMEGFPAPRDTRKPDPNATMRHHLRMWLNSRSQTQ